MKMTTFASTLALAATLSVGAYAQTATPSAGCGPQMAQNLTGNGVNHNRQLAQNLTGNGVNHNRQLAQNITGNGQSRQLAAGDGSGADVKSNSHLAAGDGSGADVKSNRQLAAGDGSGADV